MAETATESPDFECVVTAHPAATELRLRGELDLASAPRLAEHLGGACERGFAVTVDLSELTYCDSSGIRELLEGVSRCAEHETRLTVTGAHGTVRRVLDITGVAAALGLADERS